MNELEKSLRDMFTSPWHTLTMQAEKTWFQTRSDSLRTRIVGRKSMFSYTWFMFYL